MKNPPFIVTATLPGGILAWADALRREHYPPERNHLPAHVTLFHSFAPSLFEELKDVLPRFAAEECPIPAQVVGVMDLGKGTAIALRSPGMLDLRERIAEHFHGSLTAQDLHEPRLHITIQNKVTRDEARELQRALADDLDPREFQFPGLELHIYRGGPWELIRAFVFRGKAKP